MKPVYSNTGEVSNPHADAHCDMTGTHLHCADVIVLMALQQVVTSPHSLSHPVCSCFSSHPHAILPSHNQPRCSAFSFTVTPPSPFASARFLIYRNYLIFLTVLLYLNDLAVSLQQHFCGGVTGRRGKVRFAFSSELLKSVITPPAPSRFNANTETFSPLLTVDVIQIMFPPSFF